MSPERAAPAWPEAAAHRRESRPRRASLHPLPRRELRTARFERGHADHEGPSARLIDRDFAQPMAEWRAHDVMLAERLQRGKGLRAVARKRSLRADGGSKRLEPLAHQMRQPHQGPMLSVPRQPVEGFGHRIFGARKGVEASAAPRIHTLVDTGPDNRFGRVGRGGIGHRSSIGAPPLRSRCTRVRGATAALPSEDKISHRFPRMSLSEPPRQGRRGPTIFLGGSSGAHKFPRRWPPRKIVTPTAASRRRLCRRP